MIDLNLPILVARSPFRPNSRLGFDKFIPGKVFDNPDSELLSKGKLIVYAEVSCLSVSVAVSLTPFI